MFLPLYIMPKIKLVRSDKPEKKWKVIIEYREGQRTRTIHFGASGYKDYTIGATDQQRTNYRNRHRKEANQSFDTAGRLSYDILWGSTRSVKTNFANYKKKFNLKPL
jgi:hypothetical protein